MQSLKKSTRKLDGSELAAYNVTITNVTFKNKDKKNHSSSPNSQQYYDTASQVIESFLSSVFAYCRSNKLRSSSINISNLIRIFGRGLII